MNELKGKPTPGPWEVKTTKQSVGPRTYEIRSHEGLLIASLNIGMFDVEANANIMAASPELLYALDRAHHELRRLDKNNEWMPEIREAIDKARGRSPEEKPQPPQPESEQ